MESPPDPIVVNENTPFLHTSNLHTSYEWWERPREALGTTQHLQFADPQGSINLVAPTDPSGSSSSSSGGNSGGGGSGSRSNRGGGGGNGGYSSPNRGNGRDSDYSASENHSNTGLITETPQTAEPEIGSLAPRAGGTDKKLNAWLATAISGNDITSSVLYTSGYAGIVCGVFAPFALALVSILLGLFRPIYTEVVTALPMNGGTYNALLNTTSKKVASVAGALSLLSYTATAVVSADSAMSYLQQLWTDLNIFWSVIILLGIFALLNLLGLTESAVVATVLFAVHCATLLMLIGFCSVKFFKDFTLLKANWQEYTALQAGIGDYFLLLFKGYGASMLGITGFETSANYVEEQAPGVFPLTLRNMWICVAFFNPVISFLSTGILPVSVITDPTQSSAILSLMGDAAAGATEIGQQTWLGMWVSIDAVLVLSGAVLTAYVGVTGLIRRLALDRIAPQTLLQENPLRHTNHYIIIGFFLLCSSLFAVANGQIDTLSGVYTSAFLCVMGLFALANMMLKYKRSRLPREAYAAWPIVIIAFFGVVAAFVANALVAPFVLLYFLVYFIATMLLFLLMFWRVRLLKILLYFCKILVRSAAVHTAIAKQIQKLSSSKVIFFTRDDNLAVLNKAMLYVRGNEQTNWVLMVHVYQEEEAGAPSKLEEHCRLLEQLWPKYRVDYIAVKGQFGPALIDQLSEKLGVPKNFMFITTPSSKFAHKLADLGGVRLVTH